MSRVWTVLKLRVAFALFKLDRKFSVALAARILRTCDVPGHNHGVTILSDRLEGKRK